jgi:hypothetical protein
MRIDEPKSPRRAENERIWFEQNREAIEAYNLLAAAQGPLSDVAGVLTSIDPHNS